MPRRHIKIELTGIFDAHVLGRKLHVPLKRHIFSCRSNGQITHGNRRFVVRVYRNGGNGVHARLSGSATQHDLGVHNAWSNLANGFDCRTDSGNHIGCILNAQSAQSLFDGAQVIQQIVGRKLVAQNTRNHILQGLISYQRNVLAHQIADGHRLEVDAYIHVAVAVNTADEVDGLGFFGSSGNKGIGRLAVRNVL